MTYGVTPAGFSIKPLQAILGDIETAQLGTMDATIDLSPTGPQGQLNGIVANALSDLWILAGVCFNSFNRQSTEGAGLDNIGDLIGVPREGSSYTQVYCTLTFTSGTVGTTFAAGALVANVAGNGALTFSNFAPITVSSTSMTSVLMQAQTIGATPSINPGTLTAITSPVSGWSAITNPLAQSQAGANQEVDSPYAARQEEELSAEGTCNPPATVAAVIALGAEQSPPVAISAVMIENTTAQPTQYGSLTVPPHSFALVVYDPTNWVGTTGVNLIGQVVWNNKPSGIASYGTTNVTISDEFLGSQVVSYTIPSAQPLYLSARIVLRPGFTLAAVTAAIQAALVAAAVAPTPSGGAQPTGQLLPGAPVVGSQLEAVIMGVPGVFDVQALTFGVAASPTNTAPISVSPTSVATFASSTIATNVVITQGVFP